MSSRRRDRLRDALGRARDKLSGRERLEPGTPVELRFGDRSGTGRVGETLLLAARKMDVDIDSFCGGRCSCGTCRVSVVRGDDALTKRSLNEDVVLGIDAIKRGDRLACQARILGELEIRVPDFYGQS